MEADAPSIFGPSLSIRVDKTRDRETGGTGLGLSITHATVMMHNGSIKVNSREDEGTTVLLRVPLRQSQTQNV